MPDFYFIYIAPLFATSECDRLALLQATSVATIVGVCGIIPLGLMPNGSAAGLL